MSRKPKNKEVQRVSERELALVRQLCHCEYAPRARQYAFEKLVASRPTILGLKSVLSCFLKEDSPLYDQAKEWVTAHTLDLGKEILAAGLLLATQSQATRARVTSQLVVGEIDLVVPNEALSLLRRSESVAWSEICQATQVKHLDPMPKDTPTMRLCRAVQEDPSVADIPVIAAQLAELPDLDRLPVLRQAIVSSAIWRSDGNILPLLALKSRALHEELFRSATKMPPYYILRGFETILSGTREDHALNWSSLLNPVMANLARMSDAAERRQLALQAIDAAMENTIPLRPRIWDLCELAEVPEKALEAIMAWRYTSRTNSDLSEALEKLWRGNLDVVVFQSMPEEWEALALQALLKSEGKGRDLQPILRQYDVPPQGVWKDAVCTCLAEGWGTAGDAYAYLMTTHVDEALRAKRDAQLRDWLLKAELSYNERLASGSDLWKLDQITNAAKRDNLPLGHMLANPHLASKQAQEGYVLTPEDLDAPGVWTALLPRTTQNDRTRFERTWVWGCAGWRPVLLAQTAEARIDDALSSLFANYLPHCLADLASAAEENDLLRSYWLHRVVDGSDSYPDSSVARLALLEANKMEWLSSEQKAQLRQKFARLTCWSDGTWPFLNALFTPDELRAIFLENRDPWESSWLLHERWLELFSATPDNRSRLERKAAAFNPYGRTYRRGWLNWVELLGLQHTAKVRHRIEEMILNFLPEDELDRALTLLAS